MCFQCSSESLKLPVINTVCLLPWQYNDIPASILSYSIMVAIVPQMYFHFAGKTKRVKGVKLKALGAKGMCSKYTPHLKYGLTLPIDAKAILYVQKK